MEDEEIELNDSQSQIIEARRDDYYANPLAVENFNEMIREMVNSVSNLT
ncbi:hypothetical protein [Mucilaginibacter pedocola]|nr:hypothetical protein [Mucilaginibacter pedocola]